jgi:DNA-binding GntR family transcriptional regulator
MPKTYKKKQHLKRLGTTANDVFKRLMESILSGEFPGNTILREAQLARQWGVSRTPMREAVRRGAEAGVLILRPNHAPVVRALTTDNIDSLYELRELLELRAFDLAWPKMSPAELRVLEKLAAAARPHSNPKWQHNCLKFDRAIHACWVKKCGNSWLAADLARLHQFLRIFQSWIGRNQQFLEQAYNEHMAVFEAMREGNREAARERLQTHIRNSTTLVRALAEKENGQITETKK